MTPADRLDSLFTRYWDGALDAAGSDELARILREDSGAATQFQALCVQAVVAAELPGVPVARLRPFWSRRHVLAFGGVAAGAVALVAGGTLFRRASPPVGAVLTAVAGRVLLGSRPATDGAVAVPGDTVAVGGSGSSAVLRFPDGSEVTLTGGTTATLDALDRLSVHRGGVLATLPDTATRLVLATREVLAVAEAGAAWLTVGRGGRQTDVGVIRGRGRVEQVGGKAPLTVAAGECGSVSQEDARKHPLTAAPDHYFWNPAAPLPPGWSAGWPDDDGPSLRAELLDDPYSDAPHYQVRGENGWSRGLLTMHPDSLVRARFRVRSRSSVMTMLVARPDPPVGPASRVFLHWFNEDKVHPGAWHSLAVRAADLQMGKGQHDAAFGPPWLVFLVFITTLRDNAGLQVAEFEVTRPDRPGVVR